MSRCSSSMMMMAAAAVLAACAGIATAADKPAETLKQYQTKYYTMYTDLDADNVREATVRMTAMAEEYYRRTRGFSGVIRTRLPFYLFRKESDYLAAGGPAGSSGVFMARGNAAKLMAIAGEHPTAGTWETVQHEGFHQFVHAVIRGNIPTWVNEGLATYFGEGIFTGDGFVTGTIPPNRLGRVKGLIKAGKTRKFQDMMSMSGADWKGKISIENYDQAWSMIHFLVHGENGKYVNGLAAFINDIAVSGMRYENAWVKEFGRDLDAFENRWKQYWQDMEENPTIDLFRSAVVATMTSFYARAASQGQKFEAPPDFFQAAQAGSLKAHEQDWLPPALLERALRPAVRIGEWSIEKGAGGQGPALICTINGDKKFTGNFTVSAGRVEKVWVDLPLDKAAATKPAAPAAKPPVPAPVEQPRPPVATTPATAHVLADPMTADINLAKAYVAADKKDKARETLLQAIKDHPDSPLADEARKMLTGME